MTVKDLVEQLGLKVLAGGNGLDREIDGCYISDLLSDVMGYADAGNILEPTRTPCGRPTRKSYLSSALPYLPSR